MPTVHRYQVGTGGKHTEAGWEFTEIVLVENVLSIGLKQLYDAVRAAGVPKLGDSTIPVSTCTLREHNPEGLGGRKVKLRLVYRDHEELDDAESQEIEIGASLQAHQANKDADGKLMIVQFLDADGEWQPQTKLLAIDRPLSTIRISRMESEDPGEKSAKYAGCVNTEGGFPLRPSDAAAQTWRCNYIIGRSSDSGKTYRVYYEFERCLKDGTWLVEGVYTDPKTGAVPKDVIDRPKVQHRAIRDFKGYPEIDFRGLNLT